jgi:trehalose 6-phosphate phosphatase
MDKKDSCQMKHTLQRIIKDHQTSSNFKVTTGKKVIEFKPTINWDKGQAINLLMERYGKRNKIAQEVLPIFLGDDTTDEDGFRAIKTYTNGISVYIGNNTRETTAKYFLKSTKEVSDFLEMLLKYSRKALNK